MSEAPNGSGMHIADVAGAWVTTPWKRTAEAVQNAERLADWFAIPFVERHDRSIARLFADLKADAVIVADRQPMLYHATAPEQGLYFHPGLAGQRILGWRRGQADRLLTAAAIRPGDVIVDATLGLGVDALVLAAATGRTGRVIAIEQSWLLGRLFEYALAEEAAWYSELLANVRAGAGDVQVWHGGHEVWLQSQPDDSVDVVYFDPMFRHATKRPTSLERLRALAVGAPLSDTAWCEAQRVARRAVVLNERPGFGQFERFGLTPDRPRGRTAFGVWRKH